MKKSILIAVVAVAVLSVSCKKEYTCTCTGANIPAESKNFTMPKMKKSDAETSCATRESGFKAGGYTDASCSIYAKILTI